MRLCAAMIRESLGPSECPSIELDCLFMASVTAACRRYKDNERYTRTLTRTQMLQGRMLPPLVAHHVMNVWPLFVHIHVHCIWIYIHVFLYIYSYKDPFLLVFILWQWLSYAQDETYRSLSGRLCASLSRPFSLLLPVNGGVWGIWTMRRISRIVTASTGPYNTKYNSKSAAFPAV